MRSRRTRGGRECLCCQGPSCISRWRWRTSGVDPPVRARDRARMRWSRSNVVPVGAVGDIVICAFDTSVTAGTVKHTVSVLTGRARPGHGLAVAVRDVPRARMRAVALSARRANHAHTLSRSRPSSRAAPRVPASRLRAGRVTRSSSHSHLRQHQRAWKESELCVHQHNIAVADKMQRLQRPKVFSHRGRTLSTSEQPTKRPGSSRTASRAIAGERAERG